MLQLLLARDGDLAPALPDGLPPAMAQAPDHLELLSAPGDAARTSPVAGDEPDDVLPPVWALIAPEGPAGDRLIDLIRPLVKLREEAQGRPAPVFRVPPGSAAMSAADALRWRSRIYDSGADLGLDRAAFQLVLGDLDQVPLAIQQQQARDAAVGRLAFTDEAGYAAYADKVIAAEKAARAPGRLVLHTAHDGSRALELAYAGLAQPGEALVRAEVANGHLPIASVTAYGRPSFPGRAELLDHAAAPGPGVLLTLSHGLGPPLGGWASPAAQRARQGALALGSGPPLAGADVAAGRFMPAGLWLMFACFGAGTPTSSAYAFWMNRLATSGRPQPDLRGALALAQPFIADLPQRALANPEGPLGFIGHVDLAWTYSFSDDDDPLRARPGRFMRVLAAALGGQPIGAAFAELSRFVAETDAALAGAYADEAASPGDTAGAPRRARLWMTRQDLAGFILLGDPAARLPVGAAPKADAEPLGRAVEQVLGGKSVPEAAAANGVDAAALEQAVAAFRAAGRRALGLG